MSKRLQVILTDDEARALKQVAEREGLTVSAWVRRSLSESRAARAVVDVEQRLSTIRGAARHEFPAPDIEEMLGEIERGYSP